MATTTPSLRFGAGRPPVLLVMAKAPVPGFAKTRLAATVGPIAAAQLAMDSLLDTIEAAAGTGWSVVVALTGDLDSAPCAGELREALAGCTVIEQRGRGLGERLASAHADAAAVGAIRNPAIGHPAAAVGAGDAAIGDPAAAAHPAAASDAAAVVQIGSDTPQVSSGDLVAAYQRLAGHDAVVGPAYDGGWWLLAVRPAALAGCLADVPMSRPYTGALTLRALESRGCRVGLTSQLRDVDTADDAAAVATRCAPTSRFATRWASLRWQPLPTPPAVPTLTATATRTQPVVAP